MSVVPSNKAQCLWKRDGYAYFMSHSLEEEQTHAFNLGCLACWLFVYCRFVSSQASNVVQAWWTYTTFHFLANNYSISKKRDKRARVQASLCMLFNWITLPFPVLLLNSLNINWHYRKYDVWYYSKAGRMLCSHINLTGNYPVI